MFRELFESYKGPTKEDKKIKSLIAEYDYHYNRIDDYKKLKKVEAKNKQIEQALKELGVTEFTASGNKIKLKV